MRNADEGIMNHISIIHHYLKETGYFQRHQHYSLASYYMNP